MNPIEIITNFCNAIPARDVEALLGFFAEDAVYHNIPVDPVQGHDAIGATLRGFLDPASDAEFELRSIAESGRVVLTERIDRFTIGEKQIELLVMGTFELTAASKISAWRDYFDLGQFQKQMA